MATSASGSEAVSKDRYYDNPYSDFVADIPNEYIEESSGALKVSDAFKSKIMRKVERMLHHITHHERDIAQSGFSVYTGVAGVAMLLFFASKRLNREDLLVDAQNLIKIACNNTHKSRVNFLNGNSGVLLLNTLINPKADCQMLNKRLQEMQSVVMNPQSDMPDELLYGRVGYLYSQLYIIKNKLPCVVSDSDLKNVAQMIISSGRDLAKREKSKAPLRYKWHDKNYYGAAHGVAGILYLLLQAKEYISDNDMKNYIKPTLNNLLQHRFRSGNLMSSEGSSSDRLVQWCHGAPGAVPLLCSAYEVFGDTCYLDAAVECGDVIWQRGILRKGCGLCHGTAGNAYAFLSLYQLFMTHQELGDVSAAKYLYRACIFAEWCFDLEKHREMLPDRPYSLYEGLAGIVYYLIDLLEPMDAAFPGYTV